MSFYYPWAFWFLLVPLALAFGEWAARRRRDAADTNSKIIRAEAKRSTLSIRAETAGKSRRLFRWRLLLGLVFAVLALARPQWGRIEEPVFQQAREIIIALDLSRSMASTDVKPTRLDRAKLLVTGLIGQLKGERVGLIDFAGTAFLQCPLSSDYEILGQFLPQLNPGYMPVEGTDYDALLHTALDAFGSDDGADRFLVLLSDGGADPNDWREYIPQLKARGIRVLALGVGTAAGSMIPDGSDGFIKDDRGAVVLSKLDASTLRELAAKTGGVYADASAWVDLAKLIQDTVDKGKLGAFKDAGRIRLAERFQWSLAPALLFFIWSLWREFPVRPRPRALRLSGAAPALVAPLLLLTLCLLAAPHTIRADELSNSPAAPVTQLVGQLSASPSLSAADCATFARTTLDYATPLAISGQTVPQGPLNDALAAVAAGRSLDPKAADWGGLQAKLDALLKQQKQQSQKPDSSKNEKNNPGKSDDQNRQNQNPDRNQSSSPKNSRQNNQQNQQGQNNSPPSQSSNSTPQNGQNQGRPNQSQSQNTSGQQSDSRQNQSSFANAQNDGQQPSLPQSQPQPNSQPKPQQPQQPAGNQSTSPQTPSQQPTSEQQQPSPQPSSPQQPATAPSGGDMQQVGGARQKASTSPQDPSLAIPLERLDQVRQSDSPARLFQLMQAQDPNAKPPAHTGQTW